MTEPLAITSGHHTRVLASSTDRVAWIRARSRGVTATDAAKLSGPAAVQQAVWDKLHGTRFTGSAYTEHGKAREPVIAEWVRSQHGFEPSSLLFHAEADRRHLATPDGIRELDGGGIELCEIKTTAKSWRSIPRNYLRQVWWQQYVLGAERTLFVWEEHRDFQPISDVPEARWIERDDAAIADLIDLANRMLTALLRQGSHL